MKKSLNVITILTVVLMIFSSCTGTSVQTDTLSDDYESSIIVYSTSALTTNAPQTEVSETEAETKWDENDNIDADVESAYAALMNADTGEILYMTGGGEKIYPASTTKLLTCLYALSVCEPDVVFSPGDELDLVAPDSSLAYIRSNHSLSLEMLVEGMMLPSGNDAAYVVAAGVGRMLAGEEGVNANEAVYRFMQGLNDYAKTLGLKNTNFTAPDGYHDDMHYTTLEDMLIICKNALEDPIISKYAALSYDRVTYASGHKMEWHNSNLLIDESSEYYYKYAVGLKTGTTDEAGYCLTAAAEKNGVRLIACVFNAPSSRARFADPIELFEEGFDAVFDN